MFAFGIYALAFLLTVAEGSRRCSHRKQDLFIVVDGSRRIDPAQFDKIRTFLQNFVSRLDVGLGKTHVGLLLADHKERTKIEISLGQYGSIDSLSNAIGRLKCHGRRQSDMAYALEVVQKKVFNNKNGDRKKVNDVLIVFTNRFLPTQLEDVLRKAHKLKQKNVEIITVFSQATKIAWNVKDELTAVASIPENVLTLQSNRKLRRTLKKRICPSARAMHPTKGCVRKNHDVFFVLDGSGSIKLSYFERMKYFLIHLIKELDVGRHSTHVGLLQFSHSIKTRIEFNLGEHQTFEEVKEAILNMPYQEGGTDAGDALEIVNTKVFPQNVLYRPNVSDVVVILTDGEARDREKALEEAKKLREKRVQIITIGMGEEETVATFRKDLRAMASKSSNVFTADFKKLPYLVKTLTSEICFAKPPKTMECAHQKRDILLLVDGSASVGWQDVRTVKKFLQKLVMELNVGEDSNRVALTQFSEQGKTKTEFGFDRYYQARKISRAIHKMVYHAGKRTMLGHALELADSSIFDGFDGDRADVSNVIILVADGGAHDQTQASENAAKLRQRGVHIVTVYIANSKSEEENKDFLRSISSSPSDFYTSSFDELKYIAADLVKVVCRSK
ncbi:collagen alpha-1(XII) chain-like [Dendronephthya gigantea]|uniref:collagen alpha-1(XII) chain-like n=1 Tax=Dendronephthya gigantea TaxID=151771 RepID=UPI0010694505|nr:collagen alpha-1(XII) chain-like [Dendronephthya gigantea]